MDREGITQSEAAIWEKLFEELRAQYWVVFALKLVAIVGGGLAAAIGGGLEGPMAGVSGPTPKGYLIFSGAGSAVLAGILLLLADRGRPQLVAEVREQLTKLRHFIDLHEKLILRETWRLDCDNASRVMLETVERLLDQPGPNLETDLQALLTIAGPSLLDAFDYTLDEEYSFSIFQRVDAKSAMVRIAQNWSVPEDAAKDQRTWQKGQGFTGQCWQSNKIIAVPDANDAVARQVYAMKPEDYPADWPKDLKPDAERYQSFVCVPIKVGISREPWGILTITSNVKGRFDTVDRDNAGAANIPLAKLVAALLALIVAANTKN